jgi:hypothetical protein
MQSMHRVSVGLHATWAMKLPRAYPGIQAESALNQEGAHPGFSDKR